MKITETFLVNTSNFENIIKALIKVDEGTDKIDEKLFRLLGYDNPSDLLVIHILKALNIIDQEGGRKPRFTMLQNPEKSPWAIALGVTEAYGELFKQYPDIYKLQPQQLMDKFDAYFEGNKTELIIKYMANTFYTLVQFAGAENLRKILDEESGCVAEGVKEVANSKVFVKNGSYPTNGSSVETEILTAPEPEGNDSDDTDTVEYDHNREEGEFPVTVTTDQDLEGPFEDAILEEANDGNGTGESDAGEFHTDDGHRVVIAHLKKADLLFKLGYHQELLPELRGIISRLEDSKVPEFQEGVEKAIVRLALLLDELGNPKEALAAFDKVIDRFEESENEEYYRQASLAMLRKVELLSSDHQSEVPLPMLDKIAERLDSLDDPKLKPKVDDVLMQRVKRLIDVDNREDALKGIDQLIDRFDNTDDRHKNLEEVMFSKASLLEEMGRDEEALTAYSDFLAAFGKSSAA